MDCHIEQNNSQSECKLMEDRSMALVNTNTFIVQAVQHKVRWTCKACKLVFSLSHPVFFLFSMVFHLKAVQTLSLSILPAHYLPFLFTHVWPLSYIVVDVWKIYWGQEKIACCCVPVWTLILYNGDSMPANRGGQTGLLSSAQGGVGAELGPH